MWKHKPFTDVSHTYMEYVDVHAHRRSSTFGTTGKRAMTFERNVCEGKEKKRDCTLIHIQCFAVRRVNSSKPWVCVNVRLLCTQAVCSATCGIHTSCGTLINKSLCTACIRLFFCAFIQRINRFCDALFCSLDFRSNERRTKLQRIKRTKKQQVWATNTKEKRKHREKTDKNRTEMEQHLRALQW